MTVRILAVVAFFTFDLDSHSCLNSIDHTVLHTRRADVAAFATAITTRRLYRTHSTQALIAVQRCHVIADKRVTAFTTVLSAQLP